MKALVLLTGTCKAYYGIPCLTEVLINISTIVAKVWPCILDVFDFLSL